MLRTILKTETFNGEERPILFLPDEPANLGLIAYCSPVEGHGEASLEYYYKCKPLKDEKEATRLLQWYENIGPKEEREPVKRAFRR